MTRLHRETRQPSGVATLRPVGWTAIAFALLAVVSCTGLGTSRWSDATGCSSDAECKPGFVCQEPILHGGILTPVASCQPERSDESSGGGNGGSGGSGGGGGTRSTESSGGGSVDSTGGATGSGTGGDSLGGSGNSGASGGSAGSAGAPASAGAAGAPPEGGAFGDCPDGQAATCPASEPLCAELDGGATATSGTGGSGGFFEYLTYNVCARACVSDDDCPADPDDATAVLRCRELDGRDLCLLDCSLGRTCPPGMECYADRCMYPHCECFGDCEDECH